MQYNYNLPIEGLVVNNKPIVWKARDHTTRTATWRNVQSNGTYNKNFDLMNGLKIFIALEYMPNVPNLSYVSQRASFYFEANEDHDQTMVKVTISDNSQRIYIHSPFAIPNPKSKTFYGDYVMNTQAHNNISCGYGQTNVNCSLTISVEILTETTNVAKSNSLSQNLSSMFGDNSLADFHYRVGEKEFPVHKVILSAQSPVFHKMFSTDFKESTEGQINDVSEEGFEEFLRFIYTGEMKNFENYAKELLELAFKFKVEDLKIVCEKYLLKTLNEKDAVGTYHTAHNYCLDDLKKAAFQHIKTSFAKLNIALDDQFIDAPDTINAATMMRENLLSILKPENAKAEKVVNASRRF